MKRIQDQVPTFARLLRSARRLVVHPATRRAARLLALTTFSAVVVLAVGILIYSRYAQKRWDAYRSEAAARGVLLEIDKTPAPSLPAAENFAAADGPFGAQPSQGAASVSWLSDFDWAPLDAAPDLAKARRTGFHIPQEERSGPMPVARGNAASPQEFLTEFERNVGPQWAKVLEAEAKPKTRYSIPRVPIFVYRKVAQLHALRAAAMLALGRPAEALGEIRGGFRVARALEESGENALLYFMIQVAITRHMLEPVWEGLVSRRWSDAELSALQRELDNVSPSRGWALAMDGERAWINTVLDDLASSSWRERMREVSEMFDRESWSVAAPLELSTGVIRESQLAANRWLDAAREQVDENGRFRPDVRSAYDFEKMSDLEQRRYFFASVMAPSTLRAASETASTEVRVRQARVAVALERHRLRTGGLPGELSALVPEFIREIPQDPFDGKPMRYARDAGDAYRIWSIGDDLVDDQGKASPDDAPEVELDLVWPGLASPAVGDRPHAALR